MTPDYKELYGKHINRFKLIKGSTQATGLCPFHNENNPSFSHKGESGILRFYASGKRYKEWNDEKRFIRKTPAKCMN